MNISDNSNMNFSTSNLQRSQSAPSYVNNLEELNLNNKDQFGEFTSNNLAAIQDFNKRLSNAHEANLQDNSNSFNVSEESLVDKTKPNQYDPKKEPNSPASSRFSNSLNDKSAPITFDISNRAKLPKGIDNIRPHLENIDNVPLLVSLFTDCTPDTTKEMIQIMQEYGEVVCVLGSSSNLNNIPLFLQADTSIGILPLYPAVSSEFYYLVLISFFKSFQCILMFISHLSLISDRRFVRRYRSLKLIIRYHSKNLFHQLICLES